MTSQINGQAAEIQQLVVPICLNPLGLNPTLPPIEGAICQDNFGVMYYGDGSAWIRQINPNTVIGPDLSVNNDLCVFDGTTGVVIKDGNINSANVVQASSTSTSGNLVMYNGASGRLLQDSGKAAANIVQGPASAVDGNLCSFNLATGKLIKDSGISASSLIAGSSTTINGITLTSVGGTNPNFVNCSLYLQKITLGSFSMVIFTLNILQAVNAAGTGDTWVSAAGTIPAGYVPANELYFPASLFSAAIGGKANYGLLDIQADGTITVLSFAAAGVVNFQSLQTTYNV